MKEEKKINPIPNDLQEVSQKVQRWVSSPEGQQTIKEVLLDSEETTKKLRDARNVDPKSLHDPFTL